MSHELMSECGSGYGSGGSSGYENSPARGTKRQASFAAKTTDENDLAAQGLILENIRNLVRACTRRGSNNKEKQLLDIVAMAVVSQETVSARCGSAITRLTGLTREQQARGVALRATATTSKMMQMQVSMPRKSASSGRNANLANERRMIYDYFHDSCPLVEPNKSRPQAYRRKVRIFYLPLLLLLILLTQSFRCFISGARSSA